MQVPLYQVDAFTRQAFSGNPAAVVLLDAWLDDPVLRQIAREMNLSETAFIVARTELPDSFDLRWFTPVCEVELCGHATLASAHTLWSTGRVNPRMPIHFHTRVHGCLPCTRRADGAVTLDFPADPPTRIKAPQGLIAALGCQPKAVYEGREDLVVRLQTPADVRAVAPNFLGLARIGARGVAVTAQADESMPDVDFVSRYFAPQYGIDEDPVTGSLHCTLAPLWARKLDKSSLRARQISARGGELDVELTNTGRVRVSGHAVCVLTGSLEFPSN